MAKMIIEPGRCVDGYECPVCGNDEIELGQLYCQICGEPLEWLEECDSEDLAFGGQSYDNSQRDKGKD